MEPQQTAKAKKPKDEEHNGGARLAVASAFAFIGTKLGWAGTAADVVMLADNKPTIGGKIGALFTKEPWRRLNDKIGKQVAADMAEALAKNPEITRVERVLIKTGSKVSALTKMSQFSLITGTLGAIIGASVGWSRGDRIAKSKDVFKHPIRSIEIVLGPKPVKPLDMTPEEKSEPVYAKNATPPVLLADNAQAWQARVTQPEAEVTTVVNR